MTTSTANAGPRAAVSLAILGSYVAAASVFAQHNRIDTVTPAAPELASYGKYDTGVRTLRVIDKNRPSYHLMVAYLKEKKGIDARALLQNAAAPDVVERELHARDAW